MAIGTPVASGYATSSTSSSTGTATRPAGITDTTPIVAFVTTTNAALTTYTGWTILASGKTGTYGQMYVLARLADALASYPFIAGAGQAGVLIAYPGAQLPVAADAVVTTTTSAARTVTGAGCWVASAGLLVNSGSAIYPAGTDTQRDSNRLAQYSTIRAGLRAQDSAATVATGSQSRAFTGSQNLGAGAMMCVITPAPEASGPEPGRRLLLAA